MPSYPPQGPPAAFLQAQAMQSSHDPQRPLLHARTQTAPYGYPPPSIVTQVARTDRNLPSPRYHTNDRPSYLDSRQQPQPHHGYRDPQEYDFESESESESESEDDPEPEPQRPLRGASQRPGIRHTQTMPAPPVPKTQRPQAIVIREPRSPQVHDPNHRPSRRSSMSRPPLGAPVKYESAYDTRQGRVIVEAPRSSRRQSLQAYDKTFTEHRRARQEYHEASRPKRSSKVYNNGGAVGYDYERDYHDDDQEVELVAQAPRRRRGTDSEPRRRPRPVEVRQADDAEEYINRQRGERETLADQSYKIAKHRSSRASAAPSEPESSRSRGSDNGEIRLRIGNDAPVTLSLNGDMEGRTLQLVPIENGMNELVISGNRESTYHSERGSVRGNKKALVPASHVRRDMEEMTERSSHSGRRRREPRGEQEEPRRLLQRPRRREHGDTEYRH
ncbi:hypothetical protein OPT61_g10583 [Boeremia exigua]|uniref:Uncharacterized protein n=1 Tax=Boeremia exigua TaxID=749465 RepID=A0ACC2HPD4_9PLEO|nr:hypothetical protein OPT61_g10583 [Boeremia exigua]